MENEEIWKDIENYVGLYQVSNLGRVRTLNYRNSKGRIEILTRYKKIKKTGYISVSLFKNGKRSDLYVHKLVAQAFLLNSNNLPQVNHKDEDKTNNSVENLEWCTADYNNKYGSRTVRAAASKKARKLKA